MTQNTITQVDVSVTRPPQPNKLQQTGCYISHGGTTTAANTSTFISQLSDLASILGVSVPISSITWSSDVVTVQTSSAHGLVVGDNATINGVTPSGYDGTFAVASVADSTHFTYALLSDPGAETVLGTVINANVAEVNAMITTHFANGSNVGVYVLELGHGSMDTVVAALNTYLVDNPLKYYVYTVPRGFDANTNFHTLVGNYDTDTSLVYFPVSCTLSTYANFSTKNVYALIEAPLIPITEFTIAFRTYWILSQNPSSTNQVPPSSYSYALGVTAYPITNSQKTLFQTANCNYIGTGAEGGISSDIDFYGVMANGDALNLWYSVDWTQINLQLAITNAIINGSNSKPPLYYNQQGINVLQNVGGKKLNNGVSYGLIIGNVILTKLPVAQFYQNVNNGDYLGNAVLNAEPFGVYSEENPDDYSLEQYNGLTASYTPQLGFKHIVFNLNVTLFA